MNALGRLSNVCPRALLAHCSSKRLYVNLCSTSLVSQKLRSLLVHYYVLVLKCRNKEGSSHHREFCIVFYFEFLRSNWFAIERLYMCTNLKDGTISGACAINVRSRYFGRLLSCSCTISYLRGHFLFWTCCHRMG